MLSPKRVNAVIVSEGSVCFQAFLFVYATFLQIQPSSCDRMVPISSMVTKPPVELLRLRVDLLDKYQKTVRPLKDQKETLTVKVFYEIFHVVGLDEKYQTLTVNGKLKVFWTDEFLKWNPKNYSGINLIRFSPESIWWPQIIVEHNTKPFALYEKNRSPPITVYFNGSVQWFPQVRCDVPCSANYKHYPFDSHNCSVIIVPQTYNDSGLAVTPYRFEAEESTVVQGGTEWAVKNVTHEAETAREGRFYPSYERVHIRIHLERVSRMYRYICIIPTVVSMVTLLFGFWLLPTEMSRYLIGCSNIVVLSMLLQHMVVMIPAGRVVPLIAQYSACCLCLSAIFIIVTAIVKQLRDCNGKAPNTLLRLAHFGVDRSLCIFTFSHQLYHDGNPIFEDSTATSGETDSSGSLTPDELQRRKDWCTISVLADRVFFWCFAFCFVVLLSVLAAV